MKRGPYESKPPTGSTRAYRGRALVCEPQDDPERLPKGPASDEPEPNFVTALVKAFVEHKLKRKRRTRQWP